MAIERYATTEDLLVYGLPEAALEDVDVAVIERALHGASDTAKFYIRGQYTLPLQTINEALIEKTSWLAAYSIMNHRGYAPDAGSDNVFEKRYNAAIAWFKDIAAGRGDPGFSGSAGPDGGTTGQAAGARPFGISGSSRGYSSRGEGSNVVHDLVRTRGGFVGD